MRIALLLSTAAIICAIAAAFGVPAVHWGGAAVTGTAGLVLGLLYAAVPPLVVLGYRKLMAARARRA